ncbi:hypothetical protein NDU88_006498 [Pleurodeles waltl]|uniref:Uncharacterized protein n=1 Tax=Pleurodeles waltl TaxID=8319 RepID=A0AAV7WEH0_PLEWA|nr:hypothetical protein NDU88_006498 [Pleurodeles waltl]
MLRGGLYPSPSRRLPLWGLAGLFSLERHPGSWLRRNHCIFNTEPLFSRRPRLRRRYPPRCCQPPSGRFTVKISRPPRARAAPAGAGTTPAAIPMTPLIGSPGGSVMLIPLDFVF